MPFPRLHWYLLAFVLVTVAAFWPSYFGILDKAPAGHHMHGVTATVWILLLIWQAWSIHNKRRVLHALTGKAMFVVMPLFLAAGFWVTQITIVKEGMFKEMFGLRLSPADWGAVLFVALVYSLALRHRHKVHLHARYMLMTVVPLLAPSLVRVFTGYVPGFTIRSPDDLYRFGVALDLVFAGTIVAMAAWVLWDKKNGRPLIPGILGISYLVFSLLAFHWFGKLDVYHDAAYQISALPTFWLLVAGIVLGIVAGWWGWTRGARKTTASAPDLASLPRSNPG